MNILHISVFFGFKERHGGVKRSEQISEILENQDSVTINPYKGLKASFFSAVRSPSIIIKLFLFSSYLFLFKGLAFRGALKFSIKGVEPVKIVKNSNFDILILETAPGTSILFMLYLSYKRIKYIVVPHNIEHMVPGQASCDFRSKGRLFEAEYDGFNNAESVWVISEFDQSILSCNGVKSRVVPYYPVRYDLSNFETLFNRRKANLISQDYLLLGTVGNKPTYDGMKLAIQDYRHTEKLIVVGFGTETLKFDSHENIVVLGGMSDDELFDLLVKVKGVLINQPQTTGFLTKIVDLNIAGVPVYVVSDYQQARGLDRFGVFQIKLNQLDSLDEQLRHADFDKFPKPALNLLKETP
jgi:hypothetical protein